MAETTSCGFDVWLSDSLVCTLMEHGAFSEILSSVMPDTPEEDSLASSRASQPSGEEDLHSTAEKTGAEEIYGIPSFTPSSSNVSIQTSPTSNQSNSVSRHVLMATVKGNRLEENKEFQKKEENRKRMNRDRKVAFLWQRVEAHRQQCMPHRCLISFGMRQGRAAGIATARTIETAGAISNSGGEEEPVDPHGSASEDHKDGDVRSPSSSYDALAPKTSGTIWLRSQLCATSSSTPASCDVATSTLSYGSFSRLAPHVVRIPLLCSDGAVEGRHCAVPSSLPAEGSSPSSHHRYEDTDDFRSFILSQYHKRRSSLSPLNAEVGIQNNMPDFPFTVTWPLLRISCDVEHGVVELLCDTETGGVVTGESEAARRHSTMKNHHPYNGAALAASSVASTSTVKLARLHGMAPLAALGSCMAMKAWNSDAPTNDTAPLSPPGHASRSPVTPLPPFSFSHEAIHTCPPPSRDKKGEKGCDRCSQSSTSLPVGHAPTVSSSSCASPAFPSFLHPQYVKLEWKDEEDAMGDPTFERVDGRHRFTEEAQEGDISPRRDTSLPSSSFISTAASMKMTGTNRHCCDKRTTCSTPTAHLTLIAVETLASRRAVRCAGLQWYAALCAAALEGRVGMAVEKREEKTQARGDEDKERGEHHTEKQAKERPPSQGSENQSTIPGYPTTPPCCSYREAEYAYPRYAAALRPSASSIRGWIGSDTARFHHPSSSPCPPEQKYHAEKQDLFHSSTRKDEECHGSRGKVDDKEEKAVITHISIPFCITAELWEFDVDENAAEEEEEIMGGGEASAYPPMHISSSLSPKVTPVEIGIPLYEKEEEEKGCKSSREAPQQCTVPVISPVVCAPSPPSSRGWWWWWSLLALFHWTQQVLFPILVFTYQFLRTRFSLFLSETNIASATLSSFQSVPPPIVFQQWASSVLPWGSSFHLTLLPTEDAMREKEEERKRELRKDVCLFHHDEEEKPRWASVMRSWIPIPRMHRFLSTTTTATMVMHHEGSTAPPSITHIRHPTFPLHVSRSSFVLPFPGRPFFVVIVLPPAIRRAWKGPLPPPPSPENTPDKGRTMQGKDLRVTTSSVSAGFSCSSRSSSSFLGASDFPFACLPVALLCYPNPKGAMVFQYDDDALLRICRAVHFLDLKIVVYDQDQKHVLIRAVEQWWGRMKRYQERHLRSYDPQDTETRTRETNSEPLAEQERTKWKSLQWIWKIEGGWRTVKEALQRHICVLELALHEIQCLTVEDSTTTASHDHREEKGRGEAIRAKEEVEEANHTGKPQTSSWSKKRDEGRAVLEAAHIDVTVCSPRDVLVRQQLASSDTSIPVIRPLAPFSATSFSVSSTAASNEGQDVSDSNVVTRVDPFSTNPPSLADHWLGKEDQLEWEVHSADVSEASGPSSLLRTPTPVPNTTSAGPSPSISLSLWEHGFIVSNQPPMTFLTFLMESVLENNVDYLEKIAVYLHTASLKAILRFQKLNLSSSRRTG